MDQQLHHTIGAIQIIQAMQSLVESNSGSQQTQNYNKKIKFIKKMKTIQYM